MISELKTKIADKNQVIKSKDREIFSLQQHVGLVHAQRDRLVGFIEGRESLHKPTYTTLDQSSYPPKAVELDRLERFLEQCTLKYEGTPDINVSNDELRRRQY